MQWLLVELKILSRTEDSFIPIFVDQNEPHNSTTDIHACNSIEDPSTLNPSLEFELSESLNELTESIDTNIINKPTPVSSCSGYWKSYRESKEKEKNLENIIQSLASPMKQCVKQNLVDSVLSDVIVNVNTTSVHETTFVTNLIEYLKHLNKNRQYPLMHETMSKIFKDKMTDPSFLSWLASKLNI